MVVAASIRRSQLPTSRPRLEYIPGQMIVRFARAALGPVALALGSGAIALHEALRALPEAVTAPLEFLAGNAGLKGGASLTGAALPARMPALTAARAKAQVLQSAAGAGTEVLSGVSVLHVDANAVDAKLLRRLAGSDAIELVEPMPARWLLAEPAPDPRVNLQWALRAIRWFEAKASTIDASAQRVAVLDTGIDASHPDLADAVAHYSDNGLGKRDVLGHGTHVGGIVSALIDNAVGIAGVSRAKLAMWKVLPDKPNAKDETFYVDGESYLRSLGEVLAMGIRVVNLSIGGTAKSRTEALLFRHLADAGVVVCAASGNEYEDGNPTEYPAAYAGVIAVGATDMLNRRASFSNTGRHLHVMAPGTQILSTLPLRASAYRDQSQYDAWDGTSMASPHVAGAVSLLLAKHPALSVADVRKRLADSAARVPMMRGKRHTPSYGHGLLDLEALLR
jgi:subtilisin family serine protease